MELHGRFDDPSARLLVEEVAAKPERQLGIVGQKRPTVHNAVPYRHENVEPWRLLLNDPRDCRRDHGVMSIEQRERLVKVEIRHEVRVGLDDSLVDGALTD